MPNRHIVTCNGRRLPLTSTGTAPGKLSPVSASRPGSRVSGLLRPSRMHAPLTFDLVDTWSLALAGRLRLSCRASRRPQLRYLSGQLVRSRGPTAGALPGSRPYWRHCGVPPPTRRRRTNSRRPSICARSAGQRDRAERRSRRPDKYSAERGPPTQAVKRGLCRLRAAARSAGRVDRPGRRRRARVAHLPQELGRKTAITRWPPPSATCAISACPTVSHDEARERPGR